jgi:two-component system phosphate regulon sensor histidine kinase PhoR
VLLLDADMAVLTANRSAQEILGRGLDELVGLSLIRAVRDAAIVQVAREATGIAREVETAHGHRLRVTASALALGSIRTLLVIEDLTELRRAERARADLVANVSHELRTPLSAVRALAETLEDGVDDPEQRSRFLGLMLTEIDRITALVERLLHLSRLEAGTVGFTIEALDPADLATAAAERIAPIAARGGITIATDVEQSEEVRGDRERVLEVLANLLENATRFSPEGGTVTLRTRPDIDAVRFEVQDEGPGVLPTERSRIFERFFTGEQSRTQGGAGSGLGLAIARHTIRQLGGRIWVADSTPGATFCFTLPAMTQSAAPPADLTES